MLKIKLQVITETLRVGNIIIGVMRKAMKDVEIKGYLIPKGWCAFAYFRSVHLDENHYDWPYEFNPWRWQVSRTNFINMAGFHFSIISLNLFSPFIYSSFIHHRKKTLAIVTSPLLEEARGYAPALTWPGWKLQSFSTTLSLNSGNKKY